MIRALFIAAAVILLTACGGGGDQPINTAQAQASQPRRIVLGIGDSIMAGYIPCDGVSQRLAQHESFMRELEVCGRVIASPVGGAATAPAMTNQIHWALTPFDPALPPIEPAIVVVMLGTNDAVMGVPRDEALRNVGKILERFPRAVRVVVSPPRWDESADPWMREWSRDLQALALVNGARFVDAYTPSLTRPWQCTPYNKHPCEIAHREIGRMVASAVQSALAAP